MNRKAGYKRLYNDYGGGLDDAAMMRRVRALAVRLHVDGTAKLRLDAAPVRALESAVNAVRGLAPEAVEGDAAFQRLREDGRRMIAHAEHIKAAGSARLPAAEGAPRVLWIMEALLMDGEAELTRERLLLALAAFDEVQALTMAELWAVPQALGIALARAMARQAGTTARRVKECAQAARWVRRPSGALNGESPAFYERALKLSADWELGAAREKLLERLARRGETPERAVRLTHDQAAREALRLENLMGGLRLLEALDWEADFQEVSQADQALRRDPANVYAHMDAQSRMLVQRQTAEIARRLRLSELTVARYAVQAALAVESGRARSACYWLMDDAGRGALLARMGMSGVKLPAVTPDPTGMRCVGALAGLTALLLSLYMVCVSSPWLWPLGLPLCWTAASAVVGRFYPHFFKPKRLLKLELERLPDSARTLITVPVLLSGPDRVDAVCDQLEALGCLERDKNIEYLLLGDFADGDAPSAEGDAAIVDRARARVAAMNARAGRDKYAYLHRPRALVAADQRWMGRDRKRGALMDLNRVLLGEPGAEAAFSVENAACARLKGRFAYVVTLDADTRMLPGTVHKLVGALAHPLNRREDGRGYAVLQPRMEALPSACVNAFVRLFAGAGGVDTYPVAVSSLWQDVAGQGIYAGKGIYDVAAFQAALANALPEGRVLSHDLIEGALAGAGYLDDVCLYDGAPDTLCGTLRRLHRWIRGDWQLLPFLGNRALSGADRYRMLDNLVRSLRAPALLGLILSALWLGDANALLAALGFAFLNPALNLFGSDPLKWRRATAELAILPAMAWNALDAVGRTLWRLAISGRRLMDWVTAADAGRNGKCTNLPGGVAALLALCGLLSPGWTPAALGFALLFGFGLAWVTGMEAERIVGRAPVAPADAEALTRLAWETWRFFETSVPREGCGLPPDNVQVDPPVGAARRTSPTNIGLYLMSCLAACRLGFVGMPESLERMTATVSAVERMEKWRGHLFNWHDIDSLAPLKPRYVSSVDSGNLAAALLLCAAALEPMGAAALAGRMRKLAKDMDFAALYDERRDLFAIGMDVDGGGLSRSHYDLLASEARILSFVSLMLGQVPLKHWSRLNRACAPVGDGAALLSWSGTMFEYLMPELLMPAPPQSLLGESVRRVVQAQMAHGRRLRRPWGVSESGQYVFDARLNYQYRAFGLPQLALSGRAESEVVAPYASVLAAALTPGGAAENLRTMRALGWADDCGLYEAADYLRADGQGRPAIVKSHMAHHQGMILCALCNALAAEPLSADFMRLPEARALSPLLEERPAPRPRRGRNVRRSMEQPMGGGMPVPVRRVRPDARLPETQLLQGGGASALMTSDGAAHYWRGEVTATRFSGELVNRRDAACVHLCLEDTVEDAILGGEATFEPGLARFAAQLGPIEATMCVCLSPEDGTLIREIALKNIGAASATCAVTDVAPVALATAADYRAHGIFQNLFVESDHPAPNLLTFRRRPRRPGEAYPLLAHLACGSEDISWETDYERLVGRAGDSGRASGIAKTLTGSLGATLNPVSALRLQVTLTPGETRCVRFCLALLDEEAPEDWRRRQAAEGMSARAAHLSAAHARSMLGFLGLKPGEQHALQRLCALLVDGRLAAEAKRSRRSAEGVPSEALWALGLSGDRPILMLRVAAQDQEGALKAAIRAHGFYRAMGFALDLALLDDGEGGYDRPVRAMLDAAIDASHLRMLRGAPGGVFVLEGPALTARQRGVLRRAAALTFEGHRDFYAQAREALAALNGAACPKARPLDVGASTLAREALSLDNGYGGFAADGGYVVEVRPERPTPAPWSNILADDFGGMLLTERGGGFCWHGNSRNGRLTAYGNDSLREGWGLMLYLVNDATGEVLRLLPGKRPVLPFRVRYDGASARYAFAAERLSGEICFYLSGDGPEARIDVALENRGLRADGWRAVCFVDWLMGTFPTDGTRLSCWAEGGACFASGAMPGVAYLAASEPGAQAGAGRLDFLGRGTPDWPEGLRCEARSGGWTLYAPMKLKPGVAVRVGFALGWAADVEGARAAARRFAEAPDARLEEAEARWHALRDRLTVETPDPAINRLANECLIHQVLASRVCGRTGLYQPGGAYGFRDQLQDMLALLPYEPDRVRAHLLRCAARQFEAGDVLHWWHAPCAGVRTRVSDDRLFLPWVTAAYVRYTGDAAVLEERAPYLEDVPIPEGSEDVYAEMRPGQASGTLHDHCMRAFRASATVGTHGLALMGAGDWNDGMNRVGPAGRGESVWLSEFLAACAEAYAEIAPDAADRGWLKGLVVRMRESLEASAWDGAWYLRAYTDDGAALGGHACSACRIDAISQAWAVLAGLNAERCRQAMDSAWALLADERLNVIRLLTPPFDLAGMDPGYIRSYPPGVRENGGQYTHGALWLLLALIRLGDAARAHRALNMLLPTIHSATPALAEIYRVEPYVMAADICTAEGREGRGGWTWYTGAAGWMHTAILALLGYERRGDRVRLSALLGDWPSASVRLRHGASTYRLTCDREATQVTLDGVPQPEEFIRLLDDGHCHEARFPAR